VRSGHPYGLRLAEALKGPYSSAFRRTPAAVAPARSRSPDGGGGMNASRSWVLLLVVLTLSACGGEAGADRAAASGASDASTPSASRASQAPAAMHPCDVFPVEAVVDLFGVAAGEVEVERGQAQRNDTCEYSWRKPDWEAIEERNREALVRAMSSGAGASALEREPTEVSIFLTFHRGDFATSADAIRALDQVVERLEQGSSATVGDQTFSVQSSSEPIAGIGEKAVWNQSLGQVSAVGGTQLYYVRVRGEADAEMNRERAEAIAREIAAQL
jgi:hypothetical protein